MFANDKELLLPGHVDGSVNTDNDYPSRKNKYYRCNQAVALLVVSGLGLSIFLNVLTLVAQWQSSSTATRSEIQTGRPTYSGLKYNLPITYNYNTEYFNESGLLEERWEAISIDPMVIAVTPEWAAQKGLPESYPFPWDPSKQVYFIKVFHQLHCLKMLRHGLKSYSMGEEPSSGLHHLWHCLDSLRQDLMCHADDTPMPARKQFHSVGNGQLTQCMDFDKLVAWTQAPERQSCHHHINEYDRIQNTMERYAFCPEDSPYYAQMTAYFQKHGHHTP